MCCFFNPYTPGAGFSPSYLAGRENNIKNAEKHIDAIIHGYPQRSIIYYGLRGVGKTVLLNRIEESADNLNVLYQHFEITDKDTFISHLMATSGSFINTMSVKASVKDMVAKAFGIVKSLSITYCADDNTIAANLNQDGIHCSSTGILPIDLTELFVSMGKIALKSGNAICFFIDEIQELKEIELEALTTAIHRINQLRLPIMIFGAGLPKILKTLGDVKSYSERLFAFEEIDSLSYEDTLSAIKNPAIDFDITYSDDALNMIYKTTGGYPYFIQQLCSDIWELPDGNIITSDLVEQAMSITFNTLDKGFFAVRYDRATPQEN